jgi:hypothetical protein
MTALMLHAPDGATGQAPFRRTALVLHALDDADREWLLSRLPVAQTEPLRELLRELVDLGLPRDASLVDEALAVSQASVRTRDDGSGLEGLDGATVHALMVQEPDRLIQAVVLAREWPWRADMLARLGPVRAKRLQDLQAKMPVPEALHRECVAELARRIPSPTQASAASTNSAPGRSARLWRRWRG